MGYKIPTPEELERAGACEHQLDASRAFASTLAKATPDELHRLHPHAGITRFECMNCGNVVDLLGEGAP